MTKYVPIDDKGYRVPISEWTRKDRITYDGALPRRARDETDNDPRAPTAGYSPPDSLLKKQEFAVGGLEEPTIFQMIPPKLPTTISTSCPTKWWRRCWTTPESAAAAQEMLERLHMRLRGQAQDADRPPDNVSGGQPQRGGGMTTLKGRQTVNAEQKAMDAKRQGIGSFSASWPEVARISGNGFTSKRDPVPPSLALDTAKRRAGGKSFAERFPDAAKIKFCY